MLVWGIVVAAGSGSRFGTAKQFAHLGDRRVLDWSIDAVRSVSAGVVVALPADCVHAGGNFIAVAGGATRSASVRAALARIPAEAEVIVVHDAARPLAGPELFARVVAAVEAGADGAIPGVAVGDTIKRVDGSVVVETVDRSDLVAVQTPQAFRSEVLRAAHGAGAEATDDAALVERAGGRVVVVAGDAANLKLTVPADLTVATALVAERHG